MKKTLEILYLIDEILNLEHIFCKIDIVSND